MILKLHGKTALPPPWKTHATPLSQCDSCHCMTLDSLQDQVWRRTLVLLSENTARRPMLMQAAICGSALCGASTIACRHG